MRSDGEITNLPTMLERFMQAHRPFTLRWYVWEKDGVNQEGGRSC
jgi:hypothetical protein